MNAVLYPLCAAVAWVFLLFKIRPLVLGRRQPAMVAIAAFHLFMALGFTISVPTVWAAIDGVVGVPNLSLLLSQGCVIGLAGTQLATLTFWEHRPELAKPKVRRQTAAFAAVFAVMAVLFSFADLSVEDTVTAAVRYAAQGPYAVYLFFYVTAFAVVNYFVVLRCVRYARVVEGRWLRRGLRFMVLSGFGGLAYMLARYADIVAAPLGLDPMRWESAARLGAGMGSILSLIGLSLPGWGPRLSAMRDWLRRYRAYRELDPLWSALYAANPDIALDPDPSRLPVRDLDFRLHRRVIEIRDAQRWLRPYHDARALTAATIKAEASGLTDDDLRAHTEAAAILTALHMHAKVGALTAPATTTSPGETGGNDHESELSWLVRVARAYRTLDR